MIDTSKHPMQPIVLDEHGVARFKQNAIVRYLIDWARNWGLGLNELSMMNFSEEDHQQLAQLLGYSVSGYGDLSYVSQESVSEADAIAEELVRSKQ